MTIRMKKVKVTKDDKIMMMYEKLVRGNWDEYQFTSSERAKPDFYNAIKKLAPHVIELCELPEDYLDRIMVRGVSFSYGGMEEVMGATISAAMKLDRSNCDLNLNTPHKPSAPYNPEQEEPMDDQCLSDQCIACLENLCFEAEDYIDGDRAQINLFAATDMEKTKTPEIAGRPDLKVVKSSQPSKLLASGTDKTGDSDLEDEQEAASGSNDNVIDVDIVQDVEEPHSEEEPQHGNTGTEG